MSGIPPYYLENTDPTFLEGLGYPQDLVSSPSGGSNAESSVSPAWAIAGSVFTSLSSAYANFAAVKSQQLQMKAQASAMGFRARMLELDRVAAERRALSILRQGQSQVGQVTLAGGQERAAIRTTAASHGIDVARGGTALAEASQELIQKIDAYHINLGAVEAANAVRAGATQTGNEALFARTAQRSLRRSARAAMPEAQLVGGLGNMIAGGGSILSYRRS